LRADEELRQRKARLAWCRTCEKLVTTGTHDPDWRRQFYEGCEGPDLRYHTEDLRFFRTAMVYLL
jgi:hypothetical protein